MALLSVHSQNFASLRKNSFKTACRLAIKSSEPVRYRGQVLTPRLLRRTGNCPPPSRKQLLAQPDNSSARGTASRRAGQHIRQFRIMSWNAGHLGQQQRLKLNSTVMSSYYRRHTGRSLLSSGFPDGTASLRPRPQNKAGSLRLPTRDASLARTIRKDHLPPGQMES